MVSDKCSICKRSLFNREKIKESDAPVSIDSLQVDQGWCPYLERKVKDTATCEEFKIMEVEKSPLPLKLKSK